MNKLRGWLRRLPWVKIESRDERGIDFDVSVYITLFGRCFWLRRYSGAINNKARGWRTITVGGKKWACTYDFGPWGFSRSPTDAHWFRGRWR